MVVFQPKTGSTKTSDSFSAKVRLYKNLCQRQALEKSLIVSQPKTDSTKTTVLRNGLNRAYFSVSARLKMFISILVFRLKGQIWNPVRRDTKIYVYGEY